MTDIYATLNPYQYTANDPIANIDYMGLSILPNNVWKTVTVVAKGVHRMSAFSKVTSKILGAASLARKAGSVASIAVHGAQIAGGVINGLEVTKAVGSNGMKPYDDFMLNDDGSVTLLRRTHDKSHNFYNEKGKFLFQISEKPKPRKDWDNLSADFKKEVAWATAKVGLQVNDKENLRTYMKLRAKEEGWDAFTSIAMLSKLGERNEKVLGMDAIMSFSPIPISQNYREGGPSSLAGIIPYIKLVDAFYPVITHGRDLQYDITHPQSTINAGRNIQGTSVWERIKNTFNSGIRAISNWEAHILP